MPSRPSFLPSSRHFAPVIVTIGLGLPLAGLQAAPQDPASAQAAGQIGFGGDVVNPQVPAKDRAVLLAKGKAVAEVALATRALREPRGFALNSFVRVDFFHDSAKVDGDPFPISGTLLLRKIDLRSHAKPDAQGRYPGSGEGPTLKFKLNELMGLYPNNAVAESRRGGYLALPAAAIARGADGLYRFEQGLQQIIVIAAPGRAPFVHVTRQEYLQQLIAELYPSGVDTAPKPGKGLGALQAELAALSPEQQQAPACSGGRGRSWLSHCEDRGASYLVRPNLDYFDRRKPRSAPQLITLSVPLPWVGEDREEGDRLRSAVAELDFGRLQAMLAD